MKKVILLLLMVLMAIGAEARTVRDMFTSEPGRLFVLLPRTARLDLLDYYDNGQVVAAKNNMGGGSSLVTVADNYLSIKMSESKNVQMLMVPSKKDTVVVVIETFETPVKDSHISFYDTRWNELDAHKYFTMPTLDDFVGKEMDTEKRAQLMQDVAFPLISLSLEGEDHTMLVARHGLKEFLVSGVYKTYEKDLVPALLYSLKGTKWKLLKNK